MPATNGPTNTADSTSDLETSSWRETIQLPRWVVYCQAALLGIVAIVFFLFGVMVGYFTTQPAADGTDTVDCRVQGTVACRLDGSLQADDGAVVFLLPKQRKPDERSPGSLVCPGSFKELDNVALDRIYELGGAVVRTHEDGSFSVDIDSNYGSGLDYYLLVVSKNKQGEDTEQMTKEQYAVIGTFFIPVEDVVEDRSFYWTEVKAFGERLDIPEIEL